MKERGFTLIEVLIVLFIMSILSVLSWQALDHVDRAKQRLDQTQHHISSIQAVLQQLEYDIQHHVNLSMYVNQGVALPFTASTPLELHGLHWEQGETASTLFILHASAHQWQWAQWTFKDNQLYRDEAPASVELPLPIAKPTFLAMPHISTFQVNAWVPARGWQNPPLSTQGQRRATGVEIQLQLQEREQLVTYRKVVVLP
mgnify:CR=1 FL=1